MTSNTDARLPLDDLKVVELGSMVAGPFAGTLLADFGAQVLKIEANMGDTLRLTEPVVDGQSLYWAVDARNKNTVSCDLRDADSRNAFLEIIAETDVLVENFRPGTLEKWGLSPDLLLRVNPDLVIVRVTGFGQTGARTEAPAFDRVVQAISGYAANNGRSEDPPLAVGSFVSDYTSGLFGAFGGLVALHAVSRGLKGQVVDVSSLDCLVRMSEIDLSLKDTTGQNRPRLGSGHIAAAPIGTYATKDGKWVMIHVPTNRMFDNLCSALGDESLRQDSRFVDNGSRVRNREELDAIIVLWFVQHVAASAMEALVAHEVPAALVGSTGDLIQDSSLRDRGAIVDAPSPLGDLAMPGVVPLLSHTPGAVRSGAHAEVGAALSDWWANEKKLRA